ncbi:MAG: uridine kinase [Bacillota bacterium]
MKPILFLVAGGSASGKTTVVKEILKHTRKGDVLKINHDDYYLNQDHLSMEERRKINYDHPASLDNDLMYEHLKELLAGKRIEKPVYDFIRNTRSDKVEVIEPRPIIIVEGILVLHDARIRSLSNMNIFVELDDDTRFIRRLTRDMKERGRTMESVIQQYLGTVKPMHHQYIKPTKRYADVIIPNDHKHDVAVDLVATKIKDTIYTPDE